MKTIKLGELSRAIVVGLLAMGLVRCAATPPRSDDWEDASKLLTITVVSRPTGAEVFGLSGDNVGARIGSTPLTLRFYHDEGAFDSYGVWCDRCGDAIDQVIEVSNEDPFLLGTERSYVKFKCVVIKDGYEPFVIRDAVLDWSANTLDPFDNPDIRKAFEGVRKDYTAVLVSSVPSPTPAAPIPPVTYQQQQQQQTVIVGGAGNQATFGTVNLSCDLQDAEIYVDGMFVGNAPNSLKLGEGVHVIEVKKAGYESYRKELKVLGDSELTLRAKLSQ